MREIKFRAWDKSYGMVYQDKDSPSFGNQYCSLGDVFVYHAKHFEIMQYTGLKDKNGKEIYEGDIIGYANPDFLPHHPKYLVYYALEAGNYPAYDVKPRIKGISCNGLQYLIENYEVKIYGTLYENPELLEV